MKKLFAFVLLGAFALGCENTAPVPPVNPKLETPVTPPNVNPPPNINPQPAPAFSPIFMSGYWDGYYARGMIRANSEYRQGYHLGKYDRIHHINRFKP